MSIIRVSLQKQIVTDGALRSDTARSILQRVLAIAGKNTTDGVGGQFIPDLH